LFYLCISVEYEENIAKEYDIMLELKDIQKSFGDVQVLNGINLCLERGLVYTLINIISGFLALLGTMTIQNTQLVKSNK
jgi:ABC-type sugar transport system ATPase subunit